jgi:cytochrome d ubiquinol oxidase subunit I
MIGFGVLAGLIGAVLIVQWRRGRLLSSDRLLRVAAWTVVLPLLANTAGWLFTETARQPWLVYGLLKTSAGVSSNVSNTMVAFSLFGFVALYGILGVIAARLFIRTARQGIDRSIDIDPGDATSGDGGLGVSDGVLSLAP